VADVSCRRPNRGDFAFFKLSGSGQAWQTVPGSEFALGCVGEWPEPTLIGSPTSIWGEQVEKFTQMGERVRKLEERTTRLELAMTERPLVATTWLMDLGASTYGLIQNIPILIETYRDEVIARWPEVSVYGSGLNESEAITELREGILDLYSDLNETGDEELGKLPLSWKRILQRVIRGTTSGT